MAVVQISKIQVRRGRKSQTTLPQLSGGEFGWAVDTQQLYIGNGSVGEGSPFVGNTEVLTERSNIFDLLGAYTYKGETEGDIQTGLSVSSPVTRSLQQKLDDQVNVRDFGAVGDYSEGVGTNDTAAIQRAIDQLYLTSTAKASQNSRKTVFLPAGKYKINDVLNLPPNVILVGEGSGNTIIFQDSDVKNIFRTVAQDSVPGDYVLLGMMDSNTAPSNIFIKGITFERNPGSLTATPIGLLDCLTDSNFEDCEFIGVWNPGSGEEYGATLPGANSAIQIRGQGTVTTENVNFINCKFTKTTHAVYSDYDSTRIIFKDCVFYRLFRALTLGKTSTNTPGKSFGPYGYVVDSCSFDKIDAEAWKVFNTSGSKQHRSVNNKYYDVANNSLGQGQPTLPVLDFDAPDCTSSDDYFERSVDINNVDIHKTGLSSSLLAYIPDVLGVDAVHYPTKSTVLQYNTPDVNPKILLKAPAWGSTRVVVEYTVRKSSSNLYRTGQLTINIHPDMVGGTVSPVMTDEFIYNGNSETTGSIVGGNVKFSVAVINATAVQYTRIGNTIITTTTQKPTMVLRYSNPTGPGGNATINYKVSITTGYKDFV
jgi:hypothetical protein